MELASRVGLCSSAWIGVQKTCMWERSVGFVISPTGDGSLPYL